MPTVKLLAAAEKLLLSGPKAMTQFVFELYRADPAAREEIKAAGGAKSWLSVRAEFDVYQPQPEEQPLTTCRCVRGRRLRPGVHRRAPPRPLGIAQMQAGPAPRAAPLPGQQARRGRMNSVRRRACTLQRARANTASAAASATTARARNRRLRRAARGARRRRSSSARPKSSRSSKNGLRVAPRDVRQPAA